MKPTPRSGADPDDNVSTLRFYLQIASRRRAIIAICLALPLLAALAYSLTRDARYEATSQIVLSRQNLANALTGTPDPNGYSNDFLRIVQTQAEVARSPNVARRVVRAVPGSGLTTDELLKDSTVTPTRDADLLDFTVTAGDERLATRLATAYAVQFVAYRRELDTSSLKGALDQLNVQLTGFQRDPVANRQLIAQLTTKAQELRTLITLATANATVSAPATRATQVVPAPKKYAILGLLAGMALALAIVGAFEALDTRVRSSDEIEALLGTPLLGHIGAPPKNLEGGLLMLGEPRGPDAEAFRVLRANLEFSTLHHSDLKTLMIASAVEREGKSTTISNLAVTMARAGARVILMDLDLRRPTLHRLFDLPPGPGVTDVALGRASLDDALCPVALPDVRVINPGAHDAPSGSLDVLRAGPLPPDPGEFVGSPTLANILAGARDRADIVLIDGPPVLQTGDTIALSPKIDALFLVTRQPEVRRPALQELRRRLSGSPVRVLGVVVTGESLASSGYGYGYGYSSDAEFLTKEPDQVAS